MDRKSFSQLVRRYRGPLFSFLVHLGNDEEEAADLMQGAFLRAWERRETFRGESTFKTWLFEIALNLWRNRLREERRHPEGGDDPEGLPSSSDPLADTLASERREILLEGIRRLPERQRMALILKVYGELKYTEMAEVMKCSVGAAKAHFHHAFYQLKKIVEERDEM